MIFAANRTSISAAGSGTMITSTLVIIAIGRIKSCTRPTSEAGTPLVPSARPADNAIPDAKKISVGQAAPDKNNVAPSGKRSSMRKVKETDR